VVWLQTWSLAGYNDLNKEKLGAAGACEAVVRALQTWGKREENVAEQGCSAICWLLASTDASRDKLVAAGACEAVTAALQAWGTRDEGVA